MWSRVVWHVTFKTKTDLKYYNTRINYFVGTTLVISYTWRTIVITYRSMFVIDSSSVCKDGIFSNSRKRELDFWTVRIQIWLKIHALLLKTCSSILKLSLSPYIKAGDSTPVNTGKCWVIVHWTLISQNWPSVMSVSNSEDLCDFFQ